MTIKSDRWIRRMAQEHGMIEPFIENQVRQGVISYGLSSYGYDMRIANEFKVFTNVFNTLVDPKHFDARSFVDMTADYCDIPPNSFALARTVEYFRIPRNVLAICLGKSTYARCFHGMTRVALADDTNPTFYDMVGRAQQGERFWGYGIGEDRRICVTELLAPRWIGRDALIEIELDTGECIQCTPDHRMLLRNGLYEQAANIRPGDRLMPLYRNLQQNHEAVMQLDGSGWHRTHRLADDWNRRHGADAADIAGFDRHHRDGNRRNNRPTNITRMAAAAHARLHNDLSAGAPARQFGQQPGDTPDAAREQASERSRPSWHYASAERSEHPRAIARQRNPARGIGEADVLAGLRAAGSIRAAARLLECDRAVFQRFAHVIEGWHQEQGPAQRSAQRSDLTDEAIRQTLDETDGSLTAAAALLGCSRTAARRRVEPIVERWKADRLNHRVANLRHIAGEHDLFCVTAPDTGNFALGCGVFVHNCGIIVNTTPFEPGWRGYVTLELSNSTPLPARIYANEGIGQVLFFESDEDCEISYDDKQGKYLDQVGVVPPRL